MPIEDMHSAKGELRRRANGAPERVRTSDPKLRRLVLYPAELRARARLPYLLCTACANRAARQGLQSGLASAMTETPIAHIDGLAGGRRHFRYFDYVMACFVGILLLSNLIGAAKLSSLAGYTFGAGILFFPVSYVLGDVMTEVYGYANARRCVWMGFFALLFMAFMSFVVVAMPPSDGWGCAASGDDGRVGHLRARSPRPRSAIRASPEWWRSTARARCASRPTCRCSAALGGSSWPRSSRSGRANSSTPS